jgi:hypothetical protein
MKLVKDDREPELYRPTRLRGDLLRRPGDARELSRSPEQARAIAELVAFTRKRQGCTPGPIERRLFEDAVVRGPGVLQCLPRPGHRQPRLNYEI